MSEIPLLQVAQNQDGVIFVAIPIALAQELIEFVHAQRIANLMPNDPELLQARADDNAKHAAERFPQLELIWERSGPDRLPRSLWVERESQAEVVFTPHGWRIRKDVEHDLSQ